MKGIALSTAFVLALGVIPEQMTFNGTEQVYAATAVKITSPTDGKLLAAGYNDFTWESVDNTQTYNIYVDGNKVGTSTTTGFRYYTTSVALHKLKVESVQNNGSIISSQEITFGISKKGLAVNDTMGKHINPVELKASWYYDWSTNPHSYTGYEQIEFVPMIWGVGNDGDITKVNNYNYKYLLAYNEPDMGYEGGGSNTSVDVVLEHWPNFNLANRNFILGSPAPAFSPSWGNGTWMQEFMNRVDQSTIDFIPLHCYYNNYSGADAARTFLADVVDKTYEMYHKPIWITEFAPSGYGYNDAEGRAKAKAFLETAFEGLDERPYVERYSWFSYNTDDNNNGASALWTNDTGVLTDLGRTFIECGNPQGYEPPKPKFTFTTSTRNQLLPDSVSIDSKTYADLAKGASISATSEINNNSSAGKAIDEDIGSRWESVQKVDPQDVILDLGESKLIKKLDIIWEAACAQNYTVEVSEDGQDYEQVAEVKGVGSKQNRYDSILFDSGFEAVGRYIKIHGTKRALDYGYSIYDMAVYGEKYNKIPNEIYGLQYSTARNGFRIISNVEAQIDGKNVVEYGNILGIKSNGYSANDMVVGSNNQNIRSFKSTSVGLSEVSYSKSATANSYIMTFVDNGTTSDAYSQQYAIRAYAILSDGTKVYSDIVDFSIYSIADSLYREKSMPTLQQHNFLFNNILKVVNNNYQVVQY